MAEHHILKAINGAFESFNPNIQAYIVAKDWLRVSGNGWLESAYVDAYCVSFQMLLKFVKARSKGLFYYLW